MFPKDVKTPRYKRKYPEERRDSRTTQRSLSLQVQVHGLSPENRSRRILVVNMLLNAIDFADLPTILSARDKKLVLIKNV